MTREEAKEWLPRPTIISTHSDENHPDNKPWMAYEMAIKALEQDPCEDCISRQALIQSIKGHRNFFVTSYGSYKDMTPKEKVRVDEIDNCIARVVNAPPVTPQPKIGHWMKQDLGYQCSNCTLCTNEKGRLTYNYCPNCGTKMVEPQESESKRYMELAKSFAQGLRTGLAESEE